MTYTLIIPVIINNNLGMAVLLNSYPNTKYNSVPELCVLFT